MNLYRQKQILKNILLIVLLFFILLNNRTSAGAKTSSKKIIRIPCGINNFLYYDNKGNVTGYCKPYIDKLAKINNWEYKYIKANWTEAVKMLEEEEIDIVFPSTKLPRYEKTMDFSQMIGGYMAPGIFALKDSKYNYCDYKNFDGAKIAVTKDSSNEKILENFAKQHNFTYKAVYIGSMAEKIQALNNGTADMAIFNTTNNITNGKVVSVLDTYPFYYTVKKGNKELLNELDRGMKELVINEPGLVGSVFKNCLIGTNKGSTAFTTYENQFITDGNEIVVGFYENTEPLAYIDKDGSCCGIYVELINKIKKETGLCIKLHPINRDYYWQELIKNGTIDFYIGSFGNISSKDNNFFTTSSFMDYETVLITQNNFDLNNSKKSKIALTYARAYWSGNLSADFKNSELLFFRTARDCLIAVKEGKADATLLNTIEYNYQCKNARFAELVQWENYRFSSGVSMVTSNNTSQIMYSVMEKALGTLTKTDIDAIVAANLNIPYEPADFIDYIYPARNTFIFLITLLSLVIIAGITIHKIRQKQTAMLKEAFETAKKANNAKSDFLSKMSHDIRTPMNAIIGMTAIATSHINDKGRVLDSLGKIDSSSRHLLGLINEVLDMSKIESGKISIKEDKFNLPELINNFLVMVQPQVKKHNHNLWVHIFDVEHEDVIGDSLRLQQAFANIMQNAVKYTPDGGNICFTIKEKPGNNISTGCYEFIFEDNGIGMPEEYLEHIFEPFSRVEDVRTSKIQGTGLGMAITKNLINMMNGSINVESKEKKGSKFTITISLKLQDKNKSQDIKFNSLPVLVACNDQVYCETACKMLNETGLKSEWRLSASETIELVQKRHKENNGFYAIILDWDISGMAAIKIANEIKRDTGDKAPFIIFTSYDWQDIETESKNSGSVLFLTMPVFKSDIVRTFASLKDGSKENDLTQKLENVKENNYPDKKLLLVEDNEINREIAIEILGMTNIQIEEAHNGEEAVNKFSASEPGYYDIILMDIQMPVMNGYEATKTIRSLNREDAKTIPIAAMTANTFAEDIEDSKNAGMNEHLAKPLDITKLDEVLKKYLE